MLMTAALAVCRLAFWVSPTATACVVACVAYRGALRVVALYDIARSALALAIATRIDLLPDCTIIEME